jgi:hypothetical protein
MARWVLIVLLVGYSISLVFVWWTTRMVPSGIVDHYRGNDAGTDTMQFPKSFAEMLTITHTHLLTMAMIFMVSGIALGLTERVSSRWRLILCVEPFVALLVSFSSMWLMRYGDPRFAILLGLSSALMAFTFYLQSFLVLRELGWRDPA